MRKVFRINNVPIWNLQDLQREFSPIAAYNELNDFCQFAKVHCLPLPLILEKKQNEKSERYLAQYFNKNFWMGIILRKSWPEAKTVDKCFGVFVKECYDEAIGGSKAEGISAVQGDQIKAQIEQEWRDAGIDKKLKFISDSGKLGTGAADIRKAITLLAICEIAELDACKQSFRVVPRPVAPANKPAVPKNDLPHKKPANKPTTKPAPTANEKKLDILAFSSEKYAPLVASPEPYRFWYYDENTLSAGSRIRTVCVNARPGEKRDDVVIIELHSRKTGQCVQQIKLKPDEFRYCNVADGKIIKFLPNASISDDQCLIRKSYDSHDYTVVPRHGDSWKLFNMNRISCTATGNADKGFLLLSEGKVSTLFYKPANDYMVKLQFDSIMMNVVEIQVLDDGYRLLLENGTVITNGIPDHTGKKVSLDQNSRYPFPQVNYKEVSEVMLSANNSSLAIIGSGWNPKVYFGSKLFRVIRDRETIKVELKEGAK